MTIEKLKVQIIQMVEDFWSDKERPLLFSRLGSANNADVSRKVKKLGFTLGEFLSEEMSENILVGSHSEKSFLVGAFPKKIGSLEQKKLDRLLEENSSTSTSSNIPRFHKTYWAAFKVRLNDKERRYLSISDEPSFLDIDMGENPPEGTIEVERKFLTTPDTSSDHDIYNKLIEWAKIYNIEVDKLILGYYSKGKSNSESIMHSILEALDVTDLQRMSIPLDIVQKLLNKK